MILLPYDDAIVNKVESKTGEIFHVHIRPYKEQDNAAMQEMEKL